MAKYRKTYRRKRRFTRRVRRARRPVRRSRGTAAISRGTSVKCHGTLPIYAPKGTGTGGAQTSVTVSFSRLNPAIIPGVQYAQSVGYNATSQVNQQRKLWEEFSVSGLSLKWTPSTMAKAGNMTTTVGQIFNTQSAPLTVFPALAWEDANSPE